MKKTEPEYYPPVENLLDLIYEHYTENNPVEKNTVAGKAAKAKEKELEEWLCGLEGMDRLVDDYVGDKIPLVSSLSSFRVLGNSAISVLLARRTAGSSLYICAPQSGQRSGSSLAEKQ